MTRSEDVRERFEAPDLALGPAESGDRGRAGGRTKAHRSGLSLAAAVIVLVGGPLAFGGSGSPAHDLSMGANPIGDPDPRLTVDTSVGNVTVRFFREGDQWCAEPEVGAEGRRLRLCQETGDPPTVSRFWNLGVTTASPSEPLPIGWIEAVHWGFTTGAATDVEVRSPSGEHPASGPLVALGADLKGFLVAVPRDVAEYDIEIRGQTCRLFAERTVLDVGPETTFSCRPPSTNDHALDDRRASPTGLNTAGWRHRTELARG